MNKYLTEKNILFNKIDSTIDIDFLENLDRYIMKENIDELVKIGIHIKILSRIEKINS